jgi:IS605 OrfB family transposase
LLSEGWVFSEFKLLNMRIVQLALRREYEVAHPTPDQAVLGVDVGVGTLAAVTVFSGGRVQRQLYLGRDIWQVKRDLGIRRSKLQAHASAGSRRARRALRKLKGYERNLTKTRCYQVAHCIVDLAKRYGATVAIEKLTGLNRSKLGRKSNRKVKRMPYSILRQALESVAWQSGVEVSMVNPRYTSQTCPRCRRRGERKGSMFRCVWCGFTANADRCASVNIARLLWERVRQSGRVEACSAQFSRSGVAVNQPARCHDIGQAMVSNHEPIASTSYIIH